MMEKRKDFFEKIMDILDDAEGKRDTNYGPFSFLSENLYVREAVVSSFDTTTSITGLKLFLSTDILEMHSKGNASRISYDQLRSLLHENSNKKYSINYKVLDECIDVEKNKEALFEKMSFFYEAKEENGAAYLENSNELFPFIFLDRLRDAVWSKLRDFFKLCEQNVCSECSKKSMVYFQFIQALALYEIFYVHLVRERAADYMEKSLNIAKEAQKKENKLSKLSEELGDIEAGGLTEQILEIQKQLGDLNNSLNEEAFKNLYELEIYIFLVIEFGISLNAMCFLLMIFEAMQVCTYEMRGLKHLSLEIKEKLCDIYDRELAILAKSNHKRATRYRAINVRIEKLLKNQYPKKEKFDEADTIFAFMQELCKPAKSRDKKLFYGLEILLGYPIYHEKNEETT